VPTVRIAIAAQLVTLFTLALSWGEGTAVSPAKAKAPRQPVVEALNAILPEASFEKATLAQVVDFLSRKADVNIIIDPVVYASAAAPPAAAVQESSSPLPAAAPQQQPVHTPARGTPRPPQGTPITLRLKNVPLKVVLKYVLRYNNLRYTVEDYAIVIIPIGWTPPEALRTEVFRLKTGSSEPLRPIR